MAVAALLSLLFVISVRESAVIYDLGAVQMQPCLPGGMLGSISVG